MQPRLALALALSCAGVAIAAVAVDLAYDLEAHLDAREGEGWRTVSTSDQTAYRDPGFNVPGCSGPEMRLLVHNDRLLASDVAVHLSYSSGPSSGPVVVLDETWHLERGETRVHEFTLPASAFAEVPGYGKPYVNVNAQVGSLYLGACVQEAA